MERTSALYERDSEVSALASLITLAQTGQGRFAAVEGPAGIGKSSLLTQVRNIAVPSGFSIATARGTELEQEFSFGIVRQLFEPLLAVGGPEEHKHLLSGAAGQAAPVFGPVPGDASTADRDFAVRHGLYWLACNLCEERPVVFVVDDAHWADIASLRFLLYLQPRLSPLKLCVVLALRPDQPAAQRDLLDRIISDPVCQVLRPKALSADAACSLVRREFARAAPGEEVEDAFLAACHRATGGNPLLLKETTATLLAESVEPRAVNAGQVTSLGPRAVARWVSFWIHRLPARHLALARAVAVLGEDTPLEQAAALADVPLTTAMQAMADLQRIELLRPSSGQGPSASTGYAHPVVQAAVYHAMTPERAWAAHRRAADLLSQAGAEAEKAAAHLLRLPPAGDPQLLKILMRAARDAHSRGSPHAAATYLRRGLGEASAPRERLEVLHQLGRTLRLTDTDASVRYLQEALPLASNVHHRAAVASLLGNGLLLSQRIPEALEVWRQALAQLPPGEPDLTARLKADILCIPLFEPAAPDLRQDLLREVGRQRLLRPGSTLGGKFLDCVIAVHDAVVGDPRAVPRALRAVQDGELLHRAIGATPLALAWWVLICADRPEALTSLDHAVTQAYREGSTSSLTTALTYRALAWLRRGSLTEAEADARDAIQATETAGISLHRLILGPLLADILMEQGHLDEAEQALDWALKGDALPLTGLIYHLLLRRAQLLRLQAKPSDALDAALAAGDAFLAAGGQNPAILPWHSEAALCLHLLDRDEEAQPLALEEVRLAHDWGAPLARGRALRVAGLVHRDEQGTALLQQAAHRLRSGPARLEYAKTAAELGAALRRAGQRKNARRLLTEACDIARRCGAQPLVQQINAELRAGGARPRSPLAAGIDALTPSERRVAELAAAGRSNREIAQALFVTPKTVEAHLASSYRKLDISSRRQLGEKLPAPA
ncbi:AAA family ATPase [Streptomyces sp. C10-9-1]|uniref:helix-turn-helix transcriptional regulator n=1 Tax=Streptomyces sp. C10-9-1 TaxID=1859285 RepID=UPI0021112CA5|nr:AAA family ATPase [Streptomyces sp. C10-9-1]MCQ6555005.1 AAA family ATPase [Streptomyces sp. C10-9-1]